MLIALPSRISQVNLREVITNKNRKIERKKTIEYVSCSMLGTMKIGKVEEEVKGFGRSGVIY